MAMATAADRWTPDRVRALPQDGNRYEVIDGELLVTPAPRLVHQRALRELLRLLDEYVVANDLGELLWSPADISLDPESLVQPDLFVVPRRGEAAYRNWTDVTALLLAVEVLSPGTARADRTVKRRYYQRSGVGEYWIADLDARLVERWRPSDDRPEVVADELAWQPDQSCLSLVIDLPRLFQAIHREA